MTNEEDVDLRRFYYESRLKKKITETCKNKRE